MTNCDDEYCVTMCYLDISFPTAPPSAPRNLSVIFQDQSVIVVAWLPPSDSGGREDVVYDINCFQCDRSPDCNYRHLCNGKLQFWPLKSNNPFTHVTVTGLQSNTSYFLRVTAENGVSYLYGPNPNRNAEIQFGTRISGDYVIQSDLHNGHLSSRCREVQLYLFYLY